MQQKDKLVEDIKKWYDGDQSVDFEKVLLNLTDELVDVISNLRQEIKQKQEQLTSTEQLLETVTSQMKSKAIETQRLQDMMRQANIDRQAAFENGKRAAQSAETARRSSRNND